MGVERKLRSVWQRMINDSHKHPWRTFCIVLWETFHFLLFWWIELYSETGSICQTKECIQMTDGNELIRLIFLSAIYEVICQTLA